MEEDEIVQESEAQKPEETQETQKDIDWRQARAVIKNLKKVAEASGKKVDDNGNVIEEKGLSLEDVDRRASELMEKKFIEKSVKAVEKEFNEDDQKIFRKYFEKASHGEEVTSDNVDEFIAMAKNMAQATAGRNLVSRSSGRGGAPNLEEAETPVYSGAVADMARMAGINFNGK